MIDMRSVWPEGRLLSIMHQINHRLQVSLAVEYTERIINKHIIMDQYP